MAVCAQVLCLFLIASSQSNTTKVRGHITDWFGRALHGVIVTAEGSDAVRLGKAMTNDEGLYEFVVPSVPQLHVTAELAGFATVTDRVAVTNDATLVWNHGLRVARLADTPQGRVSGRIVFSGKPVRGVNVALRSAVSHEFVAYTITDRQGHFEFDGILHGGLYVLTAVSDKGIAVSPIQLDSRRYKVVRELRLVVPNP